MINIITKKSKKILLLLGGKDTLLWRSTRKIYLKIKNHVRLLSKNSIFIEEGELDMCSLDNSEMILESIKLFAPISVLDVGCGTGKSLDIFLESGCDAFGIEGSAIAISKANHPDKIMQFNLNNELNLNKKFDLAWSVEVAEHIHPKYVNKFLLSLINHSDRIIITAAPPGQGGEGHFNEQPQSYWIHLFSQNNYTYDVNSSKSLRESGSYFSENVMVFYRS
ncbi:methyltransferase domain-containing protein [Armatimonas sp.]|uniref:methyltransferase domain-containing protein n=1 Tax=Armatimonas sp. TaxID=1872638 RepID=UPI00286D1BC6|nr:methyltransferase domain-containing protein [Armatimonas sp.]